MNAIDALLAGLVDYAGLFPPAALDLQTAVEHYGSYAEGEHAAVLGRFVMGVDHLDNLRSIAGGSLVRLPLSVIVRDRSDMAAVKRHMADGLRIEAVEMKVEPPEAVMTASQLSPERCEQYFEMTLPSLSRASVERLAGTSARVKLRTGGVVPEAIPSVPHLVTALKALANRGIAFKATAGLHHPVRSQHALTYAPDAPRATMHGFLNLFCAAASLYFGGDQAEGEAILAEEDEGAFHANETEVGWREQVWTAEQIAEMRANFFLSFGSCSFTEPIHDLEKMGWV